MRSTSTPSASNACSPAPTTWASRSACRARSRPSRRPTSARCPGSDATPQPERTPMSPRIILVAPSTEVGAIAREMAPAGFELVLAYNPSEFEPALGDAEYMVCYPNVRMDDTFYRAAPRLKLVQLLSAGYDAVDLEAARRAKVPVTNNGGANAVSVAEHTLMLMLAVSRKL